MPKSDDTITKTETSADSGVLDVLVIGAGFSGICMGIKLLEAGIDDFVILEKEKGIGGTWYKNTYPGAACDVPSHFYCFSFNPNPDWSRVYSPQAEIQDYIADTADKFGITPYIRFDSPVDKIDFDEQTALWSARLTDGRTYKARHLVVGSGGLNIPSLPEIQGLDNFKGPAFHTARWRHDVDLSGKRIAIIGSAASAVQIVPRIAGKVERLTIFQRTPNYIAPRNDRAYSAAEKRRFHASPGLMKLLRLKIFLRFEFLLTPMFKQNSWRRARVMKQVVHFMRHCVKDPALQEKLVPEYEMGCKRILISDDFYTTLNRDNVQVVTNGIDHIDANGITDTAGQHHEADVIVLATGFDLHKQYLSIDLVGLGGKSLRDVWADHSLAYEGAMISGFPNAYFVTGPNTAVGSTSVVYMIEAQIGFIMKCLKKAGRDKLIYPRADVTEAHNRILQTQMQDTVWATGCNSWYKSADGRIDTLFPLAPRRFARAKRQVNFDDFVIAAKTAQQRS